MSEDCLYLNVWTPADVRRRAAAGAGLLLRRRVRRRRRLGAALRRREHGAQGHRLADGQLPARRLRLPRASRADQGIAAPRVRQLRAAGSARRAAMGAEEHRRVRRRSEEGDDRRRVGRIDLGQRADGVAALEGSDRRRHRRERRLDRADAPARAARTGGRGTGRSSPPASVRASLAALRAMSTAQILDAAAKLPIGTVRIRRSTAIFSRNSPWRSSPPATRRACRCSLDGTRRRAAGAPSSPRPTRRRRISRRRCRIFTAIAPTRR